MFPKAEWPKFYQEIEDKVKKGEPANIRTTYEVLDNERQAITGGWEVSSLGLRKGHGRSGGGGRTGREDGLGKGGDFSVYCGKKRCWIMRGRLRDRRMGGKQIASFRKGLGGGGSFRAQMRMGCVSAVCVGEGGGVIGLVLFLCRRGGGVIACFGG